MGWIGYHDRPTRDEALSRELGPEYETLKSSGAWVLVRERMNDETPRVFLINVLYKRYANESTIKLIDASSGPFAFPTKSMLNEYLRLRVHTPGATENEWVEQALEHYANKAKQAKISVGDSVTLQGREGSTWSDGKEISGEYTFLGRFSATRYDGMTVRLPKDWRERYLVGGAA